MTFDQTFEPFAVRIPTAKRLTGLGETKLRELIRDGTLRSVTVGRTRLIDYASLKALIAA
jgi:excisionase family DNA binding protein